jgi:hypothetical protein
MSTPVPPSWATAARQAGSVLTHQPWYNRGDNASTLQVQLKMYQNRLRSEQGYLKQLQTQANRYKGKSDKDSRAAYTRLQKQISDAQHQLNDINAKVTDTKNKYYQSTGQYDKLLTGANRDAFLALETLFKSYGLESLAGKIYGYVKNGYSADTISILLQDTPEYKARFKGNEARLKAGLPVLSPADYINTENAYRQIMRQSGLPTGFYDSNDDFTNWISKDVSPTEVQSRVDLATQATALANPSYKQALNQMGIDDGHMAAYFLDADKSLPLLQKAAATASIGAAALGQGLTFNQSYAEQLATMGVTATQAQQGYQQVANELGTMQNLGAIYGQKFGQAEEEQSVFGTSSEATATKAGLIGQERGAFGGQTGGARAGLSQTKNSTSG